MVDTDSREGRRKLSGVSRRRFVKAAGASGVAVGLAGCISSTNGGGGGGNGGGSTDSGTETAIGTGEVTEDITVQIAGDSRMSDNIQGIREILHNNGLPDNITVDIIAGSQVTNNRQNQYQQWLGSGREEPTLLLMDSGWTIPFIARDQVQNLSQALPNDMVSTVENEYFQASVNTAQGENGDLYAIPMFPDFPTMQYRKDLLRNAGYGESDFNKWATESMSWQEFSKVTKEAMNANSDTQYGYTFQASVYEGLSCCDFNEFMTSYGGAYFGNPEENLFGPIGDRPITVDEQPVIDSIKMVRTFINGESDNHSLDGITGGIAPEAVLQWTEEPSRKPFTGGDAIMHRNWPYSITINGAEDAFGEDLGVMPIPYGVSADEAQYPMTGGPVAALGGWHMAMNPNAPSNKKQAAVQVLRAFMQPDAALANFGLQGWIPPRPSLLDSQEASNVDVIGRYTQQLKVAGENAIPRPVTVVWPQQSSQIATEVNAAYAQEKTPEKAMSDLKSTLQQIENSQ